MKYHHDYSWKWSPDYSHVDHNHNSIVYNIKIKNFVITDIIFITTITGDFLLIISMYMYKVLIAY